MERSKIVKYPGKLLARGTKKDMELEMACLDNMNWNDEDSACEESDEEGQPPKKRRRQAVSCTVIIICTADSNGYLIVFTRLKVGHQRKNQRMQIKMVLEMMKLEMGHLKGGQMKEEREDNRL